MMKLTLEQQRKRNILDKPIAELDESESDTEKEQPTKQFTAAYQVRFSKLSKLADESTIEFKKQEKETLRQQKTALLLSKARQDANKIEQYK